MIVMKFGGTSVGTGERIANVGRISKRVSERVGKPPVVVVSAMSGVTNSLVRAATTAASGDADTFRAIRRELEQKHDVAITECVAEPGAAYQLRGEVKTLLDWFENLCQSICTLGELTPRGLDAVSGLGERISARITAASMASQGIPAECVQATELIITDETYGGATPLFDESTERTRARLYGKPEGRRVIRLLSVGGVRYVRPEKCDAEVVNEIAHERLIEQHGAVKKQRDDDISGQHDSEHRQGVDVHKQNDRAQKLHHAGREDRTGHCAHAGYNKHADSPCCYIGRQENEQTVQRDFDKARLP